MPMAAFRIVAHVQCTNLQLHDATFQAFYAPDTVGQSASLHLPLKITCHLGVDSKKDNSKQLSCKSEANAVVQPLETTFVILKAAIFRDGTI
jgi:hypothetical protein